MPATKTRDQGKTSFVKELLIDNAFANTKAVNEAWSKAGMDGTISETLVNKMRSQMGLTGNLRGNRGAKAGTSAGAKQPYTGMKRGRKPKDTGTTAMGTGVSTGARTSKQNHQLMDLEADLDRVLYRVMSLGELSEVEHALREARRRLYHTFVTKQ